MDRVVLSSELVEVVGNYGIIRSRERMVKPNGIIYGKIQTWYDICADKGNGDIVSSYDSLAGAKKWAKEN